MPATDWHDGQISSLAGKSFQQKCQEPSSLRALAKQSSPLPTKNWIASSLTLLAMTAESITPRVAGHPRALIAHRPQEHPEFGEASFFEAVGMGDESVSKSECGHGCPMVSIISLRSLSSKSTANWPRVN